MRRTLRRILKAILYVNLISAVIFSVVGIALITWKPKLLIEQIQRYFVKPAPIEQIQLKGVGILGDSLSDEYRADDKRGANYPTSTYNWVEMLADKRELNFGTWGYYEEPRRQGYAYNFARSGATAESMIASGQHSGLSKYIENGDVNVVIIYIGANDFAPYLYNNGYSAIYNEEMTREDIIEKENLIVANIRTAIETLESVGDPEIFLVTIPDWGNHTAVKIGFPLPYKRYLVTQTINKTNSKIKKMADEYGAHVIENNAFFQSLRGSDTDYQIQVGDVILDQYIGQNNPKNLFLSDGIHPGTVLNGLFANYLIEQMNPYLVSPLEPLTDDEILSISGLH